MSQQEVNKQSYLNQVNADTSNADENKLNSAVEYASVLTGLKIMSTKDLALLREAVMFAGLHNFKINDKVPMPMFIFNERVMEYYNWFLKNIPCEDRIAQLDAEIDQMADPFFKEIISNWTGSAINFEIDQFVKKQKEKMAEYGSHLNLPERIHKKQITAEDFTILTKEQVEAGRPKDAYDYVL